MAIINPYRYAAPGPPGFQFGNCLLFDGVNDFVEFNKFGTGSQDTYSFSCWVYGNDIETANSPLVSSDNLNWYLRIQGSQNRVIFRAIGTNYFFNFPGFSNDTWYHVVARVSGGNARMYLNGVESTTGEIPIDIGGVSSQNWSRLGFDNQGQYLNGRMDEVGLWYGYALTPGDVATLYNSGNGANVSDVASANLHFEYHLDESGSATIAPDTSGNGNNGTLNNFTLPGAWIDHFAP